MKQFSRFLVIISFLTTGILHAQSISGTIVDEYNEPLPSVSISTQDGIAASTNFNGQYTLSLKPGKHVVTYTFIGYQPVNKELEVKGKMVVNVTMKPSMNQLNEVVVVGYGVARKRDLTGSVVSIKSTSKPLAFISLIKSVILLDVPEKAKFLSTTIPSLP